MIVHLVDGTYELFRHFYGQRRYNEGKDKPYGAVAGGFITDQLSWRWVFGVVAPVAVLAGIMGAKRTPDLIPLCHPLLLTSVAIEFAPFPGEGRVEIEATVKLTGTTGVEMEALTAVSAAALTIYDMCKAVDKEMVIGEIRLMEKHGGKSGSFVRRR